MNLFISAFIIFSLRVADQSLATLRARLISRNKPVYAALIGLIESVIWIIAVAKVINDIDKPILIAGYAIGFAAGTCMFTAREIFDKVGYFDKKLFAYNEDLDLGWRARLLGYKSFYVPESIVHHHGSAQWKWSGEKFYLLERNRWLVLLKNYSLKTITRLFPSLLLLEIIMIM